MPDAFELPRMLRAVIPLVRAHLAFVNELVALALWASFRAFQFLGAAAGRVPRLAAVVRALDDLPEPAAGLRGVKAVRIRGRTFDMIDFPAGEMRAGLASFYARHPPSG